MKRTTTIALFYTGVAAICAAIVAVIIMIRPSLTSSYEAPLAKNVDKEVVSEWFEIAKDFNATNQENKAVKLSDLRGKVWLVAEFFAVCPHCAVRNGEELRKIYDQFRSEPNFHMVCISVDPENDDTKKLADYASTLGAETKNWWFLNGGEVKTTHEYLEKELKFFGVRQRTDPLEIEANGRYAHDLGFILVDRDFHVVGKWPLADARSEDAKQRDPLLYQRLKDEMLDRIRRELAKNDKSSLK